MAVKRDDTAYEEERHNVEEMKRLAREDDPRHYARLDKESAVRQRDIDRERIIRERVDEISDWWLDKAKATIERTAPKAAEYGAADLDIMAQAMVALAGEKLADANEEERLTYGRYAACAFYAMGKAARIFGALERGVLPGPDSEFDLEVYSVMMARIRETGRWV